MKVTRHKSVVKPGWERARANGKFARDPAKAIAPQPVRHTRDYARLRNLAIRVAKHLERMLPPEEGAAPPEHPAPPLPPEYDRLLGRGAGIVDGVNTLSLLIMRLIEKERESRDPSKVAIFAFPTIDPDELDRRIAAGLDLIADQRREKAAGARTLPGPGHASDGAVGLGTQCP
jgi:hypothetical protein